MTMAQWLLAGCWGVAHGGWLVVVSRTMVGLEVVVCVGWGLGKINLMRSCV